MDKTMNNTNPTTWNKRKQYQIVYIFSIVVILLIANSCTEKKEQTNRELINQNINSILDSIKEPTIPENRIILSEFAEMYPDETGRFDFRASIQRAIDSLSASGGGTLYFDHPDGPKAWIKQTVTYKCEGPIQLKDNICLLFDQSTRLFFKFDPEDYLVDGSGVISRYEGTTFYGLSALVRGYNVKNIKITAQPGSGAIPIIDGDGEKWQKWMVNGEKSRRDIGLLESYKLIRKMNHDDTPVSERDLSDPELYFLRPCLVEFFACKNVVMEDVMIKNSPFWCIHPVFSEQLIFRDLFFHAPVVNNDGIDVESSKNVLIENIIFNNHDDNVVIKAGRDKEGRDGAIVTGTKLENLSSGYIKNGRIGGPTENVVVRDCVFKGHHAFCIGSEMSGGANNIYLVDNYSNQEVYVGVFLKSSRKRGGIIENLYVDNLNLNEVKHGVISFVPNYDGDTESKFPPTFKNIHLSNVKVRQAENGIKIHGWFDAPIENVYMDNIKIDTITTPGEPAYHIKQAKNITIKNSVINHEQVNGTFEHSDSVSNPSRQL